MRWVVGIWMMLVLFSIRAQDRFTGEIAVKFKPGFSLQEQNKGGLPRQSAQPVHSVATFKEKSHLHNLFIIPLNKAESIIEICDSLNALDGVIYAEPVYREELLEIPNDPEGQPGSAQYYLEIIQAYDAWEISKSSSDIVIGIIDTGADTDHEDLQNKLYENDDPINGLDDDNNGYVDDLHGYDFANEDADVTADGNQHGTHVSGIGTSETNNGKGIASVGYNARLSPVKIFKTEDNLSSGSYEAVIYAADNDYDIINLSWGSINSYSQFNQDIINYAVLEKDVVIVAAAGNTDSDVAYFPASYDNVLSVAATSADDTKAGFSSFHRKVDLTAPGVSIYSTQNNNTYNSDNGTSHAAPQVTGVAALVKEHLPGLSAVQIMERIRTTTDDIYSLPANETFKGKLGKGRLNAYRALSGDEAFSIRLQEPEIVSYHEEFYPGDTLELYFEAVNYLDPVINTSYQFTSSSPYLEILQDKDQTGLIRAMDTADLGPFRIVIKENTPAETTIEFGIEINERNLYEDYQLFEITTAPNQIILKNDPLSIPISGNGKLGNTHSDYLLWQGQVVSDLAGIAINRNDKIYDNLNSPDFEPLDVLSPQSTPQAFIQSGNSFSTSDGIVVEQEATLFNQNDPAFITSYWMINNSSDTLFDSYFSLYTDWQLGQKNNNRAYRDSTQTLLASYENQLFAGIRPVSNDSIIFTLIDLNDHNTDQISDSLIRIWQESDPVDSLGFFETTDIAQLISIKIDTLLPYSRSEMRFLWGIASNDSILYAALASLEKELDTLLLHPTVDETFFSCEGATVNVDPSSGDQYVFFSDPFGDQTLDTASQLSVGPLSGSDTLIYGLNLDQDYPGRIRAFQVKLIDDIAKFEPSTDTLFLGDVDNNLVSFVDKSIAPVEWDWDFGNGLQASGISDPSVSYHEPGVYPVTLYVNNSQGCTDSLTREVTVLQRPDPPSLARDRILCPEQELDFFTSNYDTLIAYLTPDNPEPVFTDSLVNLGTLNRDSVFYFSRLENGLESHRIEIVIDYQNLNTSIQFLPALDSSEADLVWIFPEDSKHIINDWQLNNLTFTNTDTATLALPDSLFVRMQGMSTNGCSFLVEDSLFFFQSPAPQIAVPVFCQGDTVEITDNATQMMGFYRDEQLSDLISKGNNLKIPTVSEDTSLFVVSLDSLIPSEVSEIILSPQNIPYEIMSDPDTLFLSDQFEVAFEVSEEFDRVSWYIDSVFQTNALSPVFSFNNERQYRITSVATSSEGCKFSEELLFFVFRERPLGVAEDRIKMYPNPVSDFFTITGTGKIDAIQLFDSQGRHVKDLSMQNGHFDARNLEPGIYLLVLSAGQNRYMHKIMVE